MSSEISENMVAVFLTCGRMLGDIPTETFDELILAANLPVDGLSGNDAVLYQHLPKIILRAKEYQKAYRKMMSELK